MNLYSQRGILINALSNWRCVRQLVETKAKSTLVTCAQWRYGIKYAHSKPPQAPILVGQFYAPGKRFPIKCGVLYLELERVMVVIRGRT